MRLHESRSRHSQIIARHREFHTAAALDNAFRAESPHLPNKISDLFCGLRVGLVKSTDFPPGCLGCWLQSATLRNRWRTLAVHPPAAAYARLTGHGCICVHWTLKLCRKTTDATRGLICRRWRRRIVSSCREHRLNLLHPWKKQRACRDSPREAGCDCTSCAPTRVRRCLLDQAHSAVTRLRLPPEAAGFDSPVGQPRGLRLLRLKQGAPATFQVHHFTPYPNG